MRITEKTFLEVVNKEFERLEINDYKAVEAKRTHFTDDQYEGGAAKVTVKVESKNDDNVFTHFHCFYFFKEYQWYVKNGYRLFLRFENKFYTISDLTVDVKKW